MWEILKRSAFWVWGKISFPFRWIGGQIIKSFRWLGVKLGFITAPPSFAAVTVSIAESKSDVSRLCEALPIELEELVLANLDQKDRENLGELYGAYFKTGNSIEGGATATVTTKNTSTYSPLETFKHRQFYVIPKVYNLLTAVEYADYEEAKTAIERDPSLMFNPVSFRFRDGSSEYISPLKYAFKVYDTYMWEIFYERVKADSVQKKEFFKQMKEQTSHINLEPFFAAYTEYSRQDQLRSKNKIKPQALYEAWFNLGKAQKAILPVHMLKEFSREEDTWRADSAFDVKVLPAPRNCRLFVYDYDGAGKIAWASKAVSSMLYNRDAVLVRNGGRSATSYPMSLGPGSIGLGVILADLKTFRRLFKVRTEDFRQLSLLSQNSPANQEHQDQSSFLSSASRVTP